MTDRPATISARLINAVSARLAAGKRVRRNLPDWGRLHIDRQLPFLVVYRRPARRADPETDRFVTGEASYLCASGRRNRQVSLAQLVRSVATTLSQEFGAFLLLEVWSESEVAESGAVPPNPRFRIHTERTRTSLASVDALEKALGRIRVQKRRATVEIVPTSARHAPGLPALLSAAEATEFGVYWLGVSIRPVWRDPGNGEIFPLLRRALSRQFARALKQALFEFTREKTTHRPAHFHSLGKRAMVKAVWEVDRRLAEVSESFDFLLQVTPTNPDAAYRRFEKAAYRGQPVFYYRPLPVDPALLKRKLYEVRIERIEDPTLALLFRGKRRELDLQLNMLMERDSARALYGSLQLYGPVGDDLLQVARRLLDRIPPRAREDSRGGVLDSAAFAELARAEIGHYRDQRPDFACDVTIRDDTVGLMVSRGNLLIGKSTRIPAARAEALIQHEIGTHALTYFNGADQPLRQLKNGLAGYDELQEGLAVLAEYLVGGLSRPRLRLLAARVVAAHALVSGARFDETFHLLCGEHGFDRKTAFTITMRIYRAGGLTKDAIYLRGLVRLLEHLKSGGALETLFVGKIGAEHVGVILELLRRRVLHRPALRPRYLRSPATEERLRRVERGLTVLDLA